MAPGSLTARDEEIARWIARMAPVTVEQVARRFGVARVIAYRRIKVLRDHGYLTRHNGGYARPGVLIPTALAEDLDGRPSPAPSLAVHQLPPRLAAIDVAIEHELAGRSLLVAGELAGHPALDERLPAGTAGPIRPTVLILDEPLLCLYAAAGPGVDGVLDELARARWLDGTTGLLLLEATQPTDAAKTLPSALELRAVDLTTAGKLPKI